MLHTHMAQCSKTPKICWKQQLSKLENYAKKLGYSVKYQPVEIDAVYFQKNEIIISTRPIPEIRFYHLLHEVGHLSIMKKKDYKDKHVCAIDLFSKTSLSYRVGILQEELDAWNEGIILANKLNLYIDRKKFEITKTKCIKTYIQWFCRHTNMLEKASI